MTATAGPCHDHTQDIGFSAIHLDEALYEIGRWVLLERPGPEAVARRLLRLRMELACVRVTRLSDTWIEQATAHHQREREQATPPASGTGWPTTSEVYDYEADGGIGG